MKNQQPVSGRSISDGTTLDIHSIFYTIQGEGPFAGQPAVFVRLADCNLCCPLCDTDYTGGLGPMGVLDISYRVRELIGSGTLVVLTGGEPFRQNIYQLCQNLTTDNGFHVQVESNGMLPVQNYSEFARLVLVRGTVTVVLSPKTARLHRDAEVLAAAYKYVVRADDVDPQDLLPVTALDHPVPRSKTIARPPQDWRGPIYIQPVDQQDSDLNDRNTKQAVESVLHCPGQRRLCLQMHKFAGLD